MLVLVYEILRSYGEDLSHPCPGLYLRHYGLHWWTDHWFGDGVPWMQITCKDHSLTVQSCVLLWLSDVSREHHWTGTSPLTLSCLLVSWRLPASTELQSTLSRVPWQHQTAPGRHVLSDFLPLNRM